LIEVDQFSGKHDQWLAFLLACTHSSTVDDGKIAFLDWTTGNGQGEYPTALLDMLCLSKVRANSGLFLRLAVNLHCSPSRARDELNA
jgi:hypothetical protein